MPRSRCCPIQCHLFLIDGNRRWFIGLIDPDPQVPVGKEVVAQHRYQVRKRPLELRPVLQVLQNQNRNQCCPNLDQERIRGGSHKGLDLEVLLDRLEKDLDLPAILVDGRNRRRPKVQMIGQQHDDLFVFCIPDFQPSQRAGIVSVRVEPLDFNELIAQDASVLRNRSFFNDPVMGIAFLAGDEENPALGPGPEKLVIKIVELGSNLYGLLPKA